MQVGEDHCCFHENCRGIKGREDNTKQCMWESESYTPLVYHMIMAELTNIEEKQQASLVNQVWWSQCWLQFQMLTPTNRMRHHRFCVCIFMYMGEDGATPVLYFDLVLAYELTTSWGVWRGLWHNKNHSLMVNSTTEVIFIWRVRWQLYGRGLKHAG